MAVSDCWAAMAAVGEKVRKEGLEVRAPERGKDLGHRGGRGRDASERERKGVRGEEWREKGRGGRGGEKE